MKIYTRLELDINGDVLAEDSFEHDGAVALMKGGKGGGSTSAPEPAPTPAKRPERKVEVTPEDVKLGSGEGEKSMTLRKSGKRSLARPTGTSSSGLKV